MKKWLALILIGALVLGLMYWGSGSWIIAAKLGGGYLLGLIILIADENWLVNKYTVSARPQLITRSPIFLVSFVVLGLYMLSASGSVIGMGIILGMATSYVLEVLLLRGRPDLLSDRFLSGTGYNLDRSGAQWMVWGMILVLVALITLVVI